MYFEIRGLIRIIEVGCYLIKRGVIVPMKN